MEGCLNLPIGCRFTPTHEELVVHYLLKKILGQQLAVDIIKEIDVYNYDPEQLPTGEVVHGMDKEAYFFTHREPEYKHGVQPRRSASSGGYWEASGEEEEVESGGKIVGFVTNLVFYRGKEPGGKKTPWTMYEYRANPNALPAQALNNALSSLTERLVVCRIRFREESGDNEWAESDHVEGEENLRGSGDTEDFASTDGSVSGARDE